MYVQCIQVTLLTCYFCHVYLSIYLFIHTHLHGKRPLHRPSNTSTVSIYLMRCTLHPWPEQINVCLSDDNRVIYRSSPLRIETGFVERRWKDVRVGDFIKVVSNEIIPADILLLHTSNPDSVCLMETANLDGETNLKQRKVVPGFSAPVRHQIMSDYPPYQMY